MEIRIGHGYDLHQLESRAPDGKPRVLGGVEIDCEFSPVSHSDGDAVLHAITDALFGAIGEPDLGTRFPNSSVENMGKDSRYFLCEAVNVLNEGGWAIGNIDITVIADKPKIGPLKDRICTSLYSLLGAPVNIKGKTHEGTCENGAIEVHVVALVQRDTRI